MYLKNLFHIFENIVSDDFCNDLIEDGETKIFENAKVETLDIKARSSKISWINDIKYQKPLSQFVQSANIESNWNFSLKEFEDLQRADQKVAYQNQIVKYLEQVLRSINNRTFLIKNAIEWKKFTSGAI